MIAVVGSASPARTYDPAVRDPEAALEAAREIGRSLAARGCRVMVFSSRADYIESAVVEGYLASGTAGPKSIQVRARYGDDVAFTGVTENRDVFDVRPEPTPDWEVAFYRAMLSVDGLVLIGGGRSTFVAGIIALARRVPVAPVAAFGGAAERVWHRFSAEPTDAQDDEAAVLSQPWRADAADEVVGALLAQRRRRADRQAAELAATRSVRRRANLGSAFAVVFVLLTLATLPTALAVPAGVPQNLTVLLAAPMLASVAGALVRNAYDSRGQWLRAAATGSAAGVIAFLLFVAAQLSTTPDLLTSEGARRLVFFVAPIAFIGGFTSELVYGKLREQDVVQTSALPPPGR